jgi:3-dehydroquinate dehydratase-2
MSRVLVINGPNLDQLGRRQPEIYGRTTLAELEEDLASFAAAYGASIEFFQTNDEAELLERIHELALSEPPYDGVIINPGALTHYSHALGDALAALSQPVVEVHISNVLEREAFRRQTAVRTTYRIYGRGIAGYSWAIRHLVNRLAWPTELFRYGGLPDQVGDIRRPKGASSGAVMLVHGGLWHHIWTADSTESIALDLTKKGWTTINLEYRRLGLGGGWPETFDDLALALDALPEVVAHRPEDIALLGHSAGGTMVLWAAPTHPGPVVAMAPFPDLEVAAADSLWARPLERLLQGERPPFAAYSPRHRGAPAGPALLAAARRDEVSPLQPIREYAEQFEAVDLLICDGDHGDFLEPSSSAWRLVSDWLETRKVTL